MTSMQQWVFRVLKPRTMFACFLCFLPVFVGFFFLSSGLIFLWEYLGFGKPRPSVTMVLFWGSLYVLWKGLFPSAAELKAFRLAEEAKKHAQRIAILDRSVANGDSGAAAALGDIYRSGAGAEQDIQRALHYFDMASAETPSAKRKAIAIRQELDDAESKRQRAQLEAKTPDFLDAACPNCAALLGISSAKCHQCGALFFTDGAGWGPVAIASQTPLKPDATSVTSRMTSFVMSGVEPGQHQKSAKTTLKGIARIVFWVAHFCLVVSVVTIGMGHINSALARLIGVALFLYMLWVSLRVVAAVVGYFNPKKIA